ncbi:DEAD/DEAH box helicase [Aureimonas altamirensis]|uniref:DEAD/DEAH box helicase n=1 Tax=Aureimonas altamirensis TaxID=370622 RepID=UPI0020375099|nr:DEAD/DEAH box helicase [Aureimonas altamirensis]MCM2504859.1 DEAD/DEAH box helicase [Aureimonas altamirensis]
METIEELQEFIEVMAQPTVRGRLQARGDARAIIRRAGQLPEGAPAFAVSLDTDLSEYGFSLLRASLALRERGEGDPAIWREGFLKAGNAFEALVRNGSPELSQRGFWRVMGAASYHLAGYAAMAFSLMSQAEEEANLAPAERVIVRLLLSDLGTLRDEARSWLRNPEYGDDALQAALEVGDQEIDDILSIMLTTAVFRAFAFFEFALLTGDTAMHDGALSILRRALRVASNVGAVSHWWIIRVARNLIDDLWGNSLHHVLPQIGPAGTDGYAALREMFLASLYPRKTAEVELWPSQIGAARRATDLTDDLVVALPTSAGKTRVAEICTLMSLSAEKRVLLVTPLRALSAQTERSFRKTFGPLGFSVSSLYGASGAMPGDQDALRSHDIVIATPEKLDFALRSNPQLLDDIGLIVLDEGHLIGPSERELRYEILVQRLLRRADAVDRRIVCLSAILPDGEQLEDLTAWVRSDAEGEAVKSSWRPTRQRFGTLAWGGQGARLTFDLDDDGPFIQNFVTEQPPIAPRRTPFPRDNPELTIAAAWQFADEGKRTLVFCTQRDHVESYATRIVDLARRGFIAPLLADEGAIERAKSVGAEWLGAEHPAVRCLELGVAIHHARLPNPFLREVERLLNEGVLTVTIASPTLAQGLNLNAAVLLVPTLYRAGTPLTGEEFANVAGRAGRAFVDLEGLVIHVMFEPLRWRRQAWRELVNASRARTLESGLIQIASEILNRLARSGTLSRDDAFEYLANNRDAWNIHVDEEDDEPFELLLEKLDHAILGLVEALDADDADLPRLIDESLNGSLWARQLARRGDDLRERQLELFRARSGLIWSQTNADQRRGHFAMGVGLESGLTLDAMADELAVLLDQADEAALPGDSEVLVASLTTLAERLLAIRPFVPDDPLPGNWREILAAWVSGTPVHEIGPDNMRFIEDVFTYRLVWALEALRTRRVALGWQPEIIAGTAAACLEAGLPRYTMAMLVRAGLPSRAAALAAINDQDPIFIDNDGLVVWLETNEVVAMTDAGDWPTPATNDIWKAFRAEMLNRISQRWTSRDWRINIEPATRQIVPVPASPYRVEVDETDNAVWVLTPDFKVVAMLGQSMVDAAPSVLTARFDEGSPQAIIRRHGRSHASWSEP